MPVAPVCPPDRFTPDPRRSTRANHHLSKSRVTEKRNRRTLKREPCAFITSSARNISTLNHLQKDSMEFDKTIENADLRETHTQTLLHGPAQRGRPHSQPFSHDAKTHFLHFTRTLCSRHTTSSSPSRCESLQDHQKPLTCAAVPRPRKPRTLMHKCFARRNRLAHHNHS